MRDQSSLDTESVKHPSPPSSSSQVLKHLEEFRSFRGAVTQSGLYFRKTIVPAAWRMVGWGGLEKGRPN